MATSIMDSIQENVNPVSVSNVLYELMLDWRTAVMQAQHAKNKTNRKNFNKKRRWIEATIGRFLNKHAEDTQRLLELHFGLVVDNRER